MPEIIKSLSNRLSWKQFVIIFAGVITFIWLLYTPGGLLGKADAVGYAVCHRINVRSFHIGDRQSPLCARCSGQYLGVILGFVFQGIIFRRRGGRPVWQVIVVLIILCLAYIFDGLNSYIHLLPNMSRFYLYEPNNVLRLITGTGFGLAISIAVYPAFNQTVWKKRDQRPAIDGIKSFVWLLLCAVVVDLMILTENPLLIYPLALISSAGVLVLLTMIYTMVLLMALKLENKFHYSYQLLFPLVGGFIIGLIQIALLDLGRYFLTGTWNGFQIG